MRRALRWDRARFLLTSSTEHAQQQQIDFVRVAQQAGVQRIVKLSQLRADPDAPARFAISRGRRRRRSASRG